MGVVLARSGFAVASDRFSHVIARAAIDGALTGGFATRIGATIDMGAEVTGDVIVDGAIHGAMVFVAAHTVFYTAERLPFMP